MRLTSVRPLLIALAAATLATVVSDQRPFDEVVERATIGEQVGASGTKCPLSQQYIDKADLNLIRICAADGLSAYQAALRYLDSTAKVFAVYGGEAELQKCLDQYGPQVIPVVAYFVENGSFEWQARRTFGELLQRLWDGQWPNWNSTKITREQIGLIAIYEIATRGDEILAEFEIVDGVAKPKPMTGAMLEAKQFFLGSAGDLETVLVRGERLPTWKETSLALLDATVVVGGVGAFAKVARVGREALAEKSVGRVAIEGAYKTVRVAGKTGWVIAPYAVAYVAITRPTLILSFGGWAAEQVGLNRMVGIFFVALVGMWAVFKLLSPVIRCGLALSRVVRSRVPEPVSP